MKPIDTVQGSLGQLRSNLASTWKERYRRFRIFNQDLYDKMRSSTWKTRCVVGVFFLFVTIGSCSAIATATRREDTSDLANPKEFCISSYSTWMAESLIARQQGIVTDPDNAAQALQAGFTQKALTAVLDRYPKQQLIRDYLHRSTQAVADYLTSPVADVDNWPLDRLSNGNAMVQNGSFIYNEALQGLAQSIDLNQRNSENGLWYWQNYPQWSYLDGMYSFAPFSAIYALNKHCFGVSDVDHESTCITNNDPLNDILLQFTLLWEHCRNATTGLLYHGYDATRKATWAGRATGSSPIVWGRSLGWYAMALVDTIQLLPAEFTGTWRRPLLSYYQELASSIMQAVDNSTGGWYQVVDQSGREGNYIESSATAMFAYALLKGARLGYIAEQDVHTARNISCRAYQYLTNTVLVREENDTLGWNGTVGVCSLNSTATYEVIRNLHSLRTSHTLVVWSQY